MFRELFALASVAALVGLTSAVGVTGCSETPATPVTDSGTADSSSTTDGGKLPADDEPGAELCYGEDPIDVSPVAYKPARIKGGSCTDSVLGLIDELLGTNDGGVSLSAIKEAISTQESAECAECVVGEDGDTWAPLVASGDGKFTQNFGGCFEVVGGKVACGKAMQQFTACLDTACSACEGNADRQECVDSAQAAACNAAQQALLQGCGAGINTYIDMCFTGTYLNDVGASVVGTVKQLCVVSPKDAGSD